ncbi:MAG: cobalt-precorrin-5B (C(1))-methyltransferase [Rhodospirillales bacterium]|nr:cobalt-precorrin-5B (C(1))-methyltransferase [Rhodospirillales bacterium]
MTGSEPDVRKPSGPLKRGWTTGACATAAATAAYQALLTGDFPDPVTITLPKGEEPSFALKQAHLDGAKATASIIKDAGDDPDVTHGAEIVVTVEKQPGSTGITFRAGDGVGTVTRPGLALDVGEPAINPGPRKMMKAVIEDLSRKYGDKTGNNKGGVTITVSVPGGEKLAESTMNGRLGIEGGISILGTTGVVIPYSCSSWIHSIHRGVDVARACGITHIAAATGRTSEAAVRDLLGMPEQALIDMGDFAGGLLKYLRKNPVEKLTIAGGAGKLTKLGQGAMDLHSARSRVDMKALAGCLSSLGADADSVTKAENANNTGEVMAMAQKLDPPLDLALGDLIARHAREAAMATLAGDTEVEVMVFSRDGDRVGHAG